ncbi:MAG: sigma 54-interacting transcriptional regulator, partial [Planctomycetota bacterium]
EARARLDGLEGLEADLRREWIRVRARALGEGDPALDSTFDELESELRSRDGLPYAEAALAAATAIEPIDPAWRRKAVGLCRRVQTLAQRKDLYALEGRALLGLAAARVTELKLDAAEEHLRAARRLLRRAGDVPRELEATRRLAEILTTGEENRARGLSLADEAIALAERVGDEHELGRALLARGRLVLHEGDLRAALKLYRRARRHLAGRAALGTYLKSLVGATYLALKLGQAREAERHARRAIRLAVGEAYRIEQVRARTNLCFALTRQGKRAAPLAETVLEEAVRRELMEVVQAARYLLGLDRVERGALASVPAWVREPTPDHGLHVGCLSVDLALLEGRVGDAEVLLAPWTGDSLFDQAKVGVRRAMIALGHARACQIAGEKDKAAAHATEALEVLSATKREGGHNEDHFLRIELGLTEVEALSLTGSARLAVVRLEETERLIHGRETPTFLARSLVLRERLGGGGADLMRRLADTRPLIMRLASLEQWRDLAELAQVVAARTPEAAERKRLRERAKSAREAMVDGLPRDLASPALAALEARHKSIARELPEERGLLVNPEAAARLLSVYRSLARERDPDTLLPRILDTAAGLVGASRAFLLLKEGHGLRVVRGRGEGIEIDSRRGGPSRTIAEEALRTGRPVRVRAALSDSRYAHQHSVASVGLDGVIAVPLPDPLGEWTQEPRDEGTGRGRGSGRRTSGGRSSHGRTSAVSRARGVVYLDDGGRGREFTADDEAVLIAFADQAALALAQAETLRREQQRRARAERSLVDITDKLARTSASLASVRAVLAERLEVADSQFEGMIGTSEAMRKVFAAVDRFAPSRIAVLIMGETGTGKELTARAIHRRSDRREEPFVAINCGAVAPSLLETEVFGHEA